MEARLQRRVQRYGWDAAAPLYEEAWRDNLAKSQQVLVEMADLEPGHRVLETAAGTGLVTLALARIVGPSGAVMASDISGEMVASCDAAAKAAGLGNVTAERMDSEALSADDGAYDRALCALGLMYMPDPVQALTEMKRVLKLGGKAAVLVWGERKNCGWADIFPIVDAEVESEVCPLFFGLGAPGALRSALTKAGFGEVTEARLPAALRFPDAKSLLEAQIDGGAVALAAKRFTQEARARVEEAFLASVESHRRGGAYEIPAEFVIATGVA